MGVMSRRFSLLLLAACMLLLFSSAVHAQYYGDLEIDVTDSGFVTISGLTNAEDLLINDTAKYTSKQGQYWLLNISSDKRFTNLVFDISLPRGSSINYLKVPGFTGVSHSEDSLVISGAASDASLEILVQYEVNRSTVSSDSSWLPVLMGVLLLLAVAIVILFRKRIFQKRLSESLAMRSYDPKRLTERQQQIMALIEKNGGSMTQGELEKQTGFVKSSLSRNIDALVRKEILGKDRVGMSNVVFIKKKE